MDAQVASMQRSALIVAGADYVVPARELGPLLGRLARTPANLEPTAVAHDDTGIDGVYDARAGDLEREMAISAMDERAHQRSERYGVPSRFACPDCGGVLWDTRRGNGPMHFRCETGHAYSPESLAELQTESVEMALWAALRALEDKAELARQRAARAEEHSLPELSRRFATLLEATQEHAGMLRAMLRLDGRPGMTATSPDPVSERVRADEREIARQVDSSELRQPREGPPPVPRRRRADA
jgi:two-component system chemotaxis response regulator CheB